MSILTYILGWPLLAALLLVFVPRNYRVIIRAIAVLATLVSAALAVKMFCQYAGAPVDADGYRFVQQIPWVESLGISYHVGVDGLNVGLILMGAIVAFAAALCSWEIQTREKEFYILLLVMTGGILGAFASGERRLVEVLDRVEICGPDDVLGLLPVLPPQPFSTRELASLLGCRLLLAQRTAYCLRMIRLIEPAGKRGRTPLHQAACKLLGAPSL